MGSWTVSIPESENSCNCDRTGLCRQSYPSDSDTNRTTCTRGPLYHFSFVVLIFAVWNLPSFKSGNHV